MGEHGELEREDARLAARKVPRERDQAPGENHEDSNEHSVGYDRKSLRVPEGPYGREEWAHRSQSLRVPAQGLRPAQPNDTPFPLEGLMTVTTLELEKEFSGWERPILLEPADNCLDTQRAYRRLDIASKEGPVRQNVPNGSG
jgi:hypothetical protein